MSSPSKPHALILPFPAQGHITSLIELSYCLADRGVRITFINTLHNHRRIFASTASGDAKLGDGETDGINFVAIPDGLEHHEDRHNFGRLTQSLMAVMPSFLEELMRNNDAKFTCFIVDLNMAWTLNIAKTAGLRAVGYWPAAAGVLDSIISIPELLRDGFIDEDGVPLKKEVIPMMSPMDTTTLPWNCIPDEQTKKIIFKYTSNNNQAISDAEMIICNSFEEVEKPIFKKIPYILPVGPLYPNYESRQDPNLCLLWHEDKQCIDWLDKQPTSSVIYVAFGSITIINSEQFQELALGLELTGRPFLWVARPNLTDKLTYPLGFEDRVANRGKIVDWSPQHKVLKHPAIACFISHCGWNSTMEGVRNGVSFLCWPYFADQLFNHRYIAEVWKIGLSLVPDENGLISKEEIGSKVKELLKDQDILARSQDLKKFALASVIEEGSSFKNLNKIVDFIREI